MSKWVLQPKYVLGAIKFECVVLENYNVGFGNVWIYYFYDGLHVLDYKPNYGTIPIKQPIPEFEKLSPTKIQTKIIIKILNNCKKQLIFRNVKRLL